MKYQKEIEVLSDDGEGMERGVRVTVIIGVVMGSETSKHDIESAIFNYVRSSFSYEGKLFKFGYSSSKIVNSGKILVLFVVSLVDDLNIRRYQRPVTRYIENNPSILFNTFDLAIGFDVKGFDSNKQNKFVIFKDIASV